MQLRWILVLANKYRISNFLNKPRIECRGTQRCECSAVWYNNWEEIFFVFQFVMKINWIKVLSVLFGEFFLVWNGKDCFKVIKDDNLCYRSEDGRKKSKPLVTWNFILSQIQIFHFSISVFSFRFSVYWHTRSAVTNADLDRQCEGTDGE